MRNLVLSDQFQIARFEFDRQELIQDPWKQLSRVSALRPLRKHLWGGGPRKASQGSLYMSHIMSSHLFNIRMLWGPPGRAGQFCPCICHHLTVWEGTDQYKPTSPGGIRLFSWLSLQSLMHNSLSAMPRHENLHPTLFQFISGCCVDQFKWNSSILKENVSLSHLPCKVPC